MDFEFSPEQRTIAEEAKELGQACNGDTLIDRDRDQIFDRDIWCRCAEAGFLRSHLSKEYDGLGRSALSTVLAMEGLGYGSRDNGLTLALGGQIWSIQEPIEEFGSEAQKKKYLPKLASGEWIGSHGVSEPESGSDALSMRATAEKTDDGYLLNGHKCYIGMAPVCDLALVFANTQPELGNWGVSAFLLERGTKGFSVSEPKSKLGTRTNLIGDLKFDNCEIEENQRLGPEGIGVSLFTKTISWERAFIHAGHLGAMERLFEKSIEYARERRQFGQRIGDFQAVSHRLANMKLRQESARLLLYKTASLKDSGQDAALECAMTKLHVSESILANSMDAIRIHGAKGYLEEYGIERDLRDHMGGVIYAGTSDVQRNLIASILGL